MAITWIKPINVRISKEDDSMLKKISNSLKLNNPNYNQSVVVRRCIKETYDGIIQTK
tara:strand:+ start:117 stop:287 length:171 start_codon:yes stop_codon:yes gene_type:complete